MTEEREVLVGLLDWLANHDGAWDDAVSHVADYCKLSTARVEEIFNTILGV